MRLRCVHEAAHAVCLQRQYALSFEHTMIHLQIVWMHASLPAAARAQFDSRCDDMIQ